MLKHFSTTLFVSLCFLLVISLLEWPEHSAGVLSAVPKRQEAACDVPYGENTR